MASFDQRDQNVRDQKNAGRDINEHYEHYEHNYPLYVPPKQQVVRNGLERFVVGMVVLFIVVVLVVLGVYIIPYAFSFVSSNSHVPAISSSQPNTTLSSYCSGLQYDDLQGAYDDYSSRLKSQISSADFVKMWSNKFIQPCVYSISNSSDQSASATITVTDVRTKTTTNYSVTLVKERNGTWKIDSFKQAG